MNFKGAAMNTIRQAAMAVVEAGGRVEYARALDNLRRELDRVEAEFAALVAENEKISNLWSLMKKERDELQAKVAEMERQEPVAWMRQWSFKGEETGFELYGVYRDCMKDAVYHGGICTPLYLAAGAKP